MGLEKIAKIQNISENELRKAEKLQSKSIDELREIARLRGFQKLDDLTEENLIFRLLKSESNPVERGYMKYFNNSTSDDTYDDETKSKINDIRLILSLGIGNRLGNIITKKYRKEIKEEHYEIERKQNLSDNEKEKIYYHLVKFANTLDKKEEYKHRDHDDEDYFVIKELENLFGDVDNDDFYNPVLDRSSFKKIMNIIKAKEIKRKKKISKRISLCDFAAFSRFNKWQKEYWK